MPISLDPDLVDVTVAGLLGAGDVDDGRGAELFGQELARGARCSADFSLVDHFELAAFPLNEVRDRFGVTPPVDPADGHHHW